MPKTMPEIYHYLANHWIEIDAAGAAASTEGNDAVLPDAERLLELKQIREEKLGKLQKRLVDIYIEATGSTNRGSASLGSDDQRSDVTNANMDVGLESFDSPSEQELEDPATTDQSNESDGADEPVSCARSDSERRTATAASELSNDSESSGETHSDSSEDEGISQRSTRKLVARSVQQTQRRVVQSSESEDGHSEQTRRRIKKINDGSASDLSECLHTELASVTRPRNVSASVDDMPQGALIEYDGMDLEIIGSTFPVLIFGPN